MNTTCPGACTCPTTPLLSDLTPEQIEAGWKRICQTLGSSPYPGKLTEFGSTVDQSADFERLIKGRNLMLSLQRAIADPASFMDSIKADVEGMDADEETDAELEARTERNAELISAFMEHAAAEGVVIPDHVFESFFDA